MKSKPIFKKVFFWLTLLFFFFSSYALTAVAKAKTIRLISPNGGETLSLGSITTINWSPNELKGGLDVSLIYNNKNLGFIARNVNASTGLYKWRVGHVLKNTIKPASGYKILIKSKTIRFQDQSDRFFTIAARSQSNTTTMMKPVSTVKKPVTRTPATTKAPSSKKLIRLLSPNGSESYQSGSDVQIRWSARGVTSNLSIHLSQDNRIIGTIAQNIKPGTNRHLWRVSPKIGSRQLVNGNYKILVMTQDRTVRDDSDNTFSIVVSQTTPSGGEPSDPPEDQNQSSTVSNEPLFINVTNPVQNSGWCPNTPYTINWDSNLPSTTNVKIDLVYRDETGYVTYRNIVSSTPNDGVYQFNGLSDSQVPVLSVGVSVRVIATDNSVYGVSGLIALGKQLKLKMSELDTWIWRHGTEYTIRWEQICDLPAPLNIKLLDLNHQHALTIASGLTPQANTFTVVKIKLHKWIVPSTLTPGSYYMRLSAGSVFHERPLKIDVPFVVPTSPEITLKRPTQNEGWCSDVSHTIEWDSTLPPGTRVKIDLMQPTSGGGFAVWRNVTPDTPDTGFFTFNDPYPGAIGVRPRVSTLDDSIASIGDVFLFGMPLSIVKPSGTFTWRKGSSYFIIWKQVCDLSGSVTLDLLDSNQQHVMTIASGLSGIAKSDLLKQRGYSWTIPMNLIPGSYFIRVTGGTKSKLKFFNIGEKLN